MKFNLKHIYLLFKIADINIGYIHSIFNLTERNTPHSIQTAIAEATRSIKHDTPNGEWYIFSKLLLILDHKGKQ